MQGPAFTTQTLRTIQTKGLKNFIFLSAILINIEKLKQIFIQQSLEKLS